MMIHGLLVPIFFDFLIIQVISTKISINSIKVNRLMPKNKLAIPPIPAIKSTISMLGISLIFV